MTAVEWVKKELEKYGNPVVCEVLWEDFDSLVEQAKEMEKQNKIDFLVWLKENHWYVYKDGTWFTSKDHPYIDGKPRKFYTEEQVIKLYENK